MKLSPVINNLLTLLIVSYLSLQRNSKLSIFLGTSFSRPVTIFIARDHHFSNELFAQVKEEDDIRIRVIGQRFELNDRSISVIGELVDKARKLKRQSGTTKRNPKLIIQQE